MQLFSEKAMLWKEKNALILADLHLGKATHFRKAGIGVPKEVELENFERFSSLLLNHNPSEVLILGDLFHSVRNEIWQEFKKLLAQFSQIRFSLVKGNHDILREKEYLMPNLSLFEEPHVVEPFSFSHIPEENPKTYNLCGHIHPAIRLRGKGLQSLRLPCFHFSETQCVLPAFGGFTGMHSIEPSKTDDVFAVSGDEVVKVL